MRRDRRSADAAAYRKLYKDPRWARLRAAQLAAEPFCQRCSTLERPVLATVVHHRREHKGDLRLFFDPANLGSLCAPCHDGPIQSAERLGFSKAVDAEGWPIDPKHPANAMG